MSIVVVVPFTVRLLEITTSAGKPIVNVVPSPALPVTSISFVVPCTEQALL